MIKIFTTPKGKIRGRNTTLSGLENLKSAVPLGLTELDERYQQNGYGIVTWSGWSCGFRVHDNLFDL